MNKVFKESKLSPAFQKKLIEEISGLVDKSQNICLLSMKGVGSTIFFKYLTSLNPAKFVYIDFHLITSIDPLSFYQLLLSGLGFSGSCKNKEDFFDKAKKQANLLLKESSKIVVICNHFNHLEKLFSQDFFDILRNLQESFEGKLLYLFHLYKPILKIIPENKLGFNIGLFSRILYLKPYPPLELVQIARILFDSGTQNDWTNKAINLSGGHCLLLQLLLRTSQIENPILDSFIKLSLKELTEKLSYQQKKTVEKIADGKTIEKIDQFLLEIGFLIKEKDSFKPFSPLFNSYFKENLHLKFSPNEEKLFSLLKKNQGKLVDKDQIFSYVWGEDAVASDWALNSMIYRLRQNQAVKQQGLVIESRKKRGYVLIKD